MQSVIFAILAGITLGSALMVVTSRNLLHSALWLIVSFFGIAGIFILLQAEFLAVVQVLVYIGAIAMLIIFAIMLTRRIMDPQQPRFNSQWGVVGGFAALLFVSLAAVVTRVAWPVVAGEVPADAIAATRRRLRGRLRSAVRDRIRPASRRHDRGHYYRGERE